MKRRRRGGTAADGRAGRGRRRRGAAATPAWGGGGRVIPLTAARRRAAERRRAEKTRRSESTRRSETTRRDRTETSARGGGAGGRGAAGARGGVGSRGAGPELRGTGTGPGTIDFHLAACVACARAGGRVVIDHWERRGSFAVREKGRNDFVTIADREAEDAILRIVRSRFPDHAVIAEESAPGGPATAGFRWYIDPLDGTTNYIHGYPLFGVSVGLADAKGMRAAAVFDPVRDEMFTAARGQGAFLNGRPLGVTRPGKLSSALLVTGIPFRSLDRLDQYLASFRGFIHGAGGIRRDGSAALDLAYVACGRFDGFWEMGLSSWDVAAGSLLVSEAGGVVTDFHGRAGYIESGDIIAAPPDIHPAMLKVVREAYGR